MTTLSSGDAPWSLLENCGVHTRCAVLARRCARDPIWVLVLFPLIRAVVTVALPLVLLAAMVLPQWLLMRRLPSVGFSQDNSPASWQAACHLAKPFRPRSHGQLSWPTA